MTICLSCTYNFVFFYLLLKCFTFCFEVFYFLFHIFSYFFIFFSYSCFKCQSQVTIILKFVCVINSFAPLITRHSCSQNAPHFVHQAGVKYVKLTQVSHACTSILLSYLFHIIIFFKIIYVCLI